MMREKRVGGVTLPLSSCPHLPYWGALKEAIVQLNVAHETGHQTVLIFDEAYKLVGTLSQRDILKGLEVAPGDYRETPDQESWDALIGKETEAQLSRPVKDFMSEIKATVEASEGILRAARVMLREDTGLLPVTEGDRVVGVVRMGDLFHQITNAILKL